MGYLSKSRYCQFWQCPKLAWLSKYRPELQEEQDESRLETGNAVGDLAMGLFGDSVEVTTYDEKGNLDLSGMINKTWEEIVKGTEVICEASFSYDGFYCAVDILRKDGDGYSIYEVKSSSTSLSDLEIKSVYIADISYQKYVLEHCGVPVTGTYLLTLNKDYVLEGDLDLSRLFNVIDVSEYVTAEVANVEENLAKAKVIMGSEVEPEIELSQSCKDPYECPFKKYCMRDIPKPSVFDLYKKRFDSMLKLYREGIVSYSELYHSGKITNDKQLRQIDYYLHDRGTYVEQEKIREFLDELSYPLYFLDFETMQPAVPVYSGTKPYQQIPFQYSLHFIETDGGELRHKEFLAKSGEDPRRAIAEALCRDIPMNVCVTAYNKRFECDRIKELARAFPDLAEHLLNVESNIVDLAVPFQQGYYYNKAMGGSFSIKSILPALFPNDPSLDYHNLEGVHNGTEAMTIYPKIKDMPADEQQEAIHNLLKYCELDTYAMVKVWEVLVKSCEDTVE